MPDFVFGTRDCARVDMYTMARDEALTQAQRDACNHAYEIIKEAESHVCRHILTLTKPRP